MAAELSSVSDDSDQLAQYSHEIRRLRRLVFLFQASSPCFAALIVVFCYLLTSPGDVRWRGFSAWWMDHAVAEIGGMDAWTLAIALAALSTTVFIARLLAEKDEQLLSATGIARVAVWNTISFAILSFSAVTAWLVCFGALGMDPQRYWLAVMSGASALLSAALAALCPVAAVTHRVTLARLYEERERIRLAQKDESNHAPGRTWRRSKPVLGLAAVEIALGGGVGLLASDLQISGLSLGLAVGVLGFGLTIYLVSVVASYRAEQARKGRHVWQSVPLVVAGAFFVPAMFVTPLALATGGIPATAFLVILVSGCAWVRWGPAGSYVRSYYLGKQLRNVDADIDEQNRRLERLSDPRWAPDIAAGETLRTWIGYL